MISAREHGPLVLSAVYIGTFGPTPNTYCRPVFVVYFSLFYPFIPLPAVSAVPSTEHNVSNAQIISFGM